MSIICPKCGRDSDSIPFIDAFCVDDFPIKVQCPAKLEIMSCKACGDMHLKGEWMPSNPRKIAAYIESKCKGDFAEAKYDIIRQMVTFTIVKGDNKMQVERTVLIDKKITTCPKCSRISGGYFEAIIQLRGDPKKVEKTAASIIKKIGKATFITKTEELDEGTDIYAGSSKAVIMLMGELGLRTLMTKKLVGRDQGKQLYRTTFLIRL
jgi:nonsense-mediated mRNA decay protein 3